MALSRGAGLAAAALILSGAARGAEDEAQRRYDARDFVGSRLDWQKRADAGDAQAAFHLGLIYDLGQGVPSDAAAAYRWYRRAAEQGVPQAEFNVAVMEDGGRGTKQDTGDAARWYARAASHGLPRAAYDLAELYRTGEGVPRNQALASDWLKVAATGAAPLPDRLGPPHADWREGLADMTVLASPVPSDAAAPAGDAPLELVWDAPAETVPVRYFATVMARQGDAWVPVLGRYTTLSSLLVPRVPGVTCYAWRVYAVGRASPHYAPSPWRRMGCT